MTTHMLERQPYVYIMASRRDGTLYIGVTSDLISRVWQHRNHVTKGFTDRYDVTRLVWYEHHATMESAIAREKALKNWRRRWKIILIEKTNPEWNDLWEEINGRVASGSRLSPG
jgi:putative endonuclease